MWFRDANIRNMKEAGTVIVFLVSSSINSFRVITYRTRTEDWTVTEHVTRERGQLLNKKKGQKTSAFSIYLNVQYREKRPQEAAAQVDNSKMVFYITICKIQHYSKQTFMTHTIHASLAACIFKY